MSEVVITSSDEISERAKKAGLLERETLEAVLKGRCGKKVSIGSSRRWIAWSG
jgi:hypothetical protein